MSEIPNFSTIAIIRQWGWRGWLEIRRHRACNRRGHQWYAPPGKNPEICMRCKARVWVDVAADGTPIGVEVSMTESSDIMPSPKLMHVDVIEQDWHGAKTRRIASYRLAADYGPVVTDPHPIDECPFGVWPNVADELPMDTIAVDPSQGYVLPDIQEQPTANGEKGP